jgi:hypothetical protein
MTGPEGDPKDRLFSRPLAETRDHREPRARCARMPGMFRGVDGLKVTGSVITEESRLCLQLRSG